MRNIAVFVAACVALVALAGDPPTGVTTNLVVYADIGHPVGLPSGYLFGRRVSLSIQEGKVVEVRDAGTFDLFSGLPESEARKRAAERANRPRPAPLFRRGTNAVQRVTR